MREEMNVSEWIGRFLAEDFSAYDVKTQIRAGWYDWFCKDSSLRNKTYRMGSIIKQLKVGGKIDFNNWYVWFKNNCPLNGPLYDDFRFADIATGQVQFTIQLDCCWNKKKYTVYGRKNDFEGALFETDKSRELVKWLNTPWED